MPVGQMPEAPQIAMGGRFFPLSALPARNSASPPPCVLCALSFVYSLTLMHLPSLSRGSPFCQDCVIHVSCCYLRWCSSGSTGIGSSQRRSLSRRGVEKYAAPGPGETSWMPTPALFGLGVRGGKACHAPAPGPMLLLTTWTILPHFSLI